MAHFAHVNKDGIVDQVIVIEADVLATGLWGDPAEWVQTSYNTFAGQHPNGTPLRKNFAGIGYTYDKTRDAFLPPKPFNSWTLDEETCQWNPPVVMPTEGGPYAWDENTLTWRTRPDYPSDGAQYVWSDEQWTWVEVIPAEKPVNPALNG